MTQQQTNKPINKPTDKHTIQTIRTLWQHHIPQKLIAEALSIKYATISMYCRGFKATDEKLSAEQICSKITGQTFLFPQRQDQETQTKETQTKETQTKETRGDS